MQTTFAFINGHSLRYRLAGAGPLAVFGHGLLGSLEQIDDNMSALEALHERVRLLVYDARGHGQSSGPAEPGHYTWETLGLDMAAFMDHADESQAIVGGASMGAASALWLAIERPERVRGLVMVMPPPLGPDAIRGDDERTAIRALDFLSAAIQNYGVEQTIALARNLPGFAANEVEADERARWIRGQNPMALTHAVRGLIQAPIHDPEQYREVRVPVLVVAHEGDGLHPLRSALLLEEMIPDCRLVVGPDPSYWRKNPAEFIAEVDAFLSRLS